jgi:alanine dehydrogenase
MTLILNNREIEKILDMGEVVDVLEDAYRELAFGRAVTRQRSDCITPTSRNDNALYGLKSMDAVIPKLGVGAIRINSDIVTWPVVEGKRRRVKVPAAPNQRYVGLVLLFSSETGEPLAIFPDGVIQRMRVGAANGLGVKYLAREDATTVGLIGSGWQAGTQLMAAAAVRRVTSIKCWSPNKEHRETFGKEMSKTLGIDVAVVGSAEEAMRDVDIAMCGTSSIEPIFPADWAKPGMHLSSIKVQEIPQSAVDRCQHVAVHIHHDGPIIETTKDLVIPGAEEGGDGKVRRWSSGKVDVTKYPTISELIAGQAEGRQKDDEITCFINNVGLGYQFAAVGAAVYQAAKKKGAGRELDTDWFTELEHP